MLSYSILLHTVRCGVSRNWSLCHKYPIIGFSVALQKEADTEWAPVIITITATAVSSFLLPSSSFSITLNLKYAKESRRAEWSFISTDIFTEDDPTAEIILLAELTSMAEEVNTAVLNYFSTNLNCKDKKCFYKKQSHSLI